MPRVSRFLKDLVSESSNSELAAPDIRPFGRKAAGLIDAALLSGIRIVEQVRDLSSADDSGRRRMIARFVTSGFARWH